MNDERSEQRNYPSYSFTLQGHNSHVIWTLSRPILNVFEAPLRVSGCSRSIAKDFVLCHVTET